MTRNEVCGLDWILTTYFISFYNKYVHFEMYFSIFTFNKLSTNFKICYWNIGSYWYNNNFETENLETQHSIIFYKARLQVEKHFTIIIHAMHKSSAFTKKKMRGILHFYWLGRISSMSVYYVVSYWYTRVV